MPSGGLDFAVTSDGVNAVTNPVFSSAWMVPCVADDSSKEALMYGTDTCTFDFTFSGVTRPLTMLYPILKHSSSTNGLCYVKTIDGIDYAVLKRGLLPFGARIDQKILYQYLIFRPFICSLVDFPQHQYTQQG